MQYNDQYTLCRDHPAWNLKGRAVRHRAARFLLGFALVSACGFASLAGAENPTLPSDPFKAELTFSLDEEPSPVKGLPMEVISHVSSLNEARTEYWVEVEFDLPKDCSLMGQAIDQWGLAFDGIQLGIWSGFNAFCNRMNYLNNGARSADSDYVSNIDFSAMSLELVPFAIECAGVSSTSFFEFCDGLSKRDKGMCASDDPLPPLNYITFNPIRESWRGDNVGLDCAVYPINQNTCNMTEGQFLGTIEVRNRRIDCLRDSNAEGIRLYDVQFRDMNRDGFMDAVLSVIQVFYASGPAGRETFVLTKKGPKESLISLSDTVKFETDK